MCRLLTRDEPAVFFYLNLRSTVFSVTFVRPDQAAASFTLPAGGCNAALIIRQSLFMGSPTDANGVHPVGRAAHIRVTSLKTQFWGVYEDSDRDTDVDGHIFRNWARAAQAALWLFFPSQTSQIFVTKILENYPVFCKISGYFCKGTLRFFPSPKTFEKISLFPRFLWRRNRYRNKLNVNM